MPRGDRTGPMSAGPRTGRGLGDCLGYDRPGFVQPAPGWGSGMGFGRGRGWRHWARATGLPGWLRFGGASPMPVDEAGLLKTQAEQLQTQLDAVQKRLAEIESD